VRRGARWISWCALVAVIAYTVASDFAFYRLGYRVNAIQSLAFLITLVIGQSFLPLSRLQRLLVLGLGSLGHVGLELAYPSSAVSLERWVSSAGLVMTASYSIMISEVMAASDLAAFRRLRQAARSLEQIEASRKEADSASRLLGVAVSQLSTVTQGLTSQSDRAGAGTRGIASGIEQLAGSASEVSKHAHVSAKALSDARAAAGQIEESVAESDRRAQAILAAVAESGASIARLERSVGSIREFVEAIEEIAAQSNLLALNASLESVRAGESGKGFRVVANEILGLAQGSRQRTVVVRKVVKAVIDDLRSTVSTVNGVQERAESFQKDFERVRGALGSLLARLRDVDGMIDLATGQTTEQASTLAQLSHAAGELAELAEANARVSGELAATTAELDALSARLQATVQG
jgi:methyl-accepting chemotaxis protein